MQRTTFSGSSLEEALKNDSLSQSGVELVGMAKSSEKKGHVCFTRSGCNNWVDLPIDMIEEAEQIGKNTCKDHSHPIMRITLKEPKDPEAKIFSALSSGPIPMQVEPRMNQAEPGFMAPQSHRIQQRATGSGSQQATFSPIAPGVSDTASACNSVCLWFCPRDSNGGIDVGCFLDCLGRCSVFNASGMTVFR